MSESISEQPLTSRLRALALQAGPDQNWIRQTMEDAIRIIVEQKDLLDGDNEQVVELETKIAELEAEASILLTQYSEYLEKYGYLDSDWWCEPPNAVDRFLEDKANG